MDCEVWVGGVEVGGVGGGVWRVCGVGCGV